MRKLPQKIIKHQVSGFGFLSNKLLLFLFFNEIFVHVNKTFIISRIVNKRNIIHHVIQYSLGHMHL